MSSLAEVSEHWTTPPYEHSAPVLLFAHPGTPRPQGSKTVRVVNGRAIIHEDAKGFEPWRNGVVKALKTAIAATPAPDGGWPLLGPVAVDLAFSMPKPKSRPKRIRSYPSTIPDVDKLARCILDALKLAQCLRDDSLVVDLHAYKVYPGETPRALHVPGLVGVVYQVIA